MQRRHSALINDVEGARRGESRIRIVTIVCGMMLILSDKLQTSAVTSGVTSIFEPEKWPNNVISFISGKISSY